MDHRVSVLFLVGVGCSFDIFGATNYCRFFSVSVDGRWTHLFGYRGIFLALRPAMQLLDIFRQMDAKYSGYRGVLHQPGLNRNL